MRKITHDAARAFIEGRNFCRGNTSVICTKFCNERSLRLHSNEIAIYSWACNPDEAYGCDMNSYLLITLAGWPTATTRDRLNGLLTELGKREGVWQNKHEQYYGTIKDNKIISSSEWITAGKNINKLQPKP